MARTKTGVRITFDWKPFHMYFPPETLEELRELSFWEKTSRAELIRQAVTALLKKKGRVK